MCLPECSWNHRFRRFTQIIFETGTGTAFGRTRSSASYDGNIDDNDNGDYNGNGDGNDDGEIRVLLKSGCSPASTKSVLQLRLYSEVMCIFVL